MLMEGILFALGIALLVGGSDFFVRSSATIARRLGISEFIIGLTLVAVGTSLPELLASIFAAAKHESGLILGNIIGSNTANIGLVIGLGAIIIGSVKTKKKILRQDGYIMLLLSFVFFLFLINGIISAVEAAILLLLYFAYMVFLFERKTPEQEKEPLIAFVKYFFRMQYILTIRSRVMTQIRKQEEGEKVKKKDEITKAEAEKVTNVFKASIVKDLLIIVLSAIAIFFGAKYVVTEAIFFATMLGIPSTLIGITAIAIGTSLPELTVTLMAAKKKYNGMVIGNILGSNIANLLLIGGVSALIFPLTVIKETIYYAAPAMLTISTLLIILMRTRHKLNRKEGVVLLSAYIIIMTILVYILI